MRAGSVHFESCAYHSVPIITRKVREWRSAEDFSVFSAWSCALEKVGCTRISVQTRSQELHLFWRTPLACIDLAVAASTPVDTRKPQSLDDLWPGLTAFSPNLAVASVGVLVDGIFDTADTYCLLVSCVCISGQYSPASLAFTSGHIAAAVFRPVQKDGFLPKYRVQGLVSIIAEHSVNYFSLLLHSPTFQ